MLQALDGKGLVWNFDCVLTVVVHHISVRVLVLLPLVLIFGSLEQTAIVSLRKLGLLLSLSTQTCVITRSLLFNITALCN